MPYPSPTLFPGLTLFPGVDAPVLRSSEFTTRFVEALAPWTDENGAWTTYNTALASMFEGFAELVSDSGDAEGNVIATLSAPISAGTSINSVSVYALGEDLADGDQLTVVDAFGRGQTFTVALAAHAGDLTISLSQALVVYDQAVGDQIQRAFIPGWSSLLDPNNCPDQFLPYLGQFNGTMIPPGSDPATARLKIVYECAQNRGQPSAISFAAKRHLGGTQSVAILERTNANGGSDPWWFILVVNPNEVLDQGALIADVNAVKPAGIQWSLAETTTWIVSQVEAGYATIADVEAAFLTVVGLENNQPGV